MAERPRELGDFKKARVNGGTITITVLRIRTSVSATADRPASYGNQIISSARPSCSVGLSSALWKNGESDPDAIFVIGRTGPGMRQVAGFGDPSTGRGTFGSEFGLHCNQWRLYGVRVRQRRDAALFPNYFGQTCLSVLVQLCVTVAALDCYDYSTIC